LGHLNLTRKLLTKSVFIAAAASYLNGIPTVPFNASVPAQSFSLGNIHAIIVDTRYATAVDNDGLTLIPPTLWGFAETFRNDLAGIEVNVPLFAGFEATEGTLFLTLSSNPNDFLDATGRPTSEGYSLKVTNSGITIAGASPLGTWWGTRTVLQQAVMGDRKISVGEGIDAPGWGERGMMVSYMSPCPKLLL
jgi:hexosaminidase